MFSDLLEKQLARNDNVSVTENGALGYKTSNNPFVDFNFKIPYYRKNPHIDIYADFQKLCKYDLLLALRYLFFLRDVRGGLGERRIFRIIFLKLIKDIGFTDMQLTAIFKLFPEYGRWDDLISLYKTGNTQCDIIIEQIVDQQLIKDIVDAMFNEPISLLAKWMPSVQNKNQRAKALSFVKALKRYDTERNYRKNLSSLRKYLNVVETKMSSGNWHEINYESVPSKANVKYNKAFLYHDDSRRRKYLEDVANGKKKINGNVNFPHDIVRQYWNKQKADAGLEALWKALPNFGTDKNIMVVADTSSSMSMYSLTPVIVCYSLAIYFSEHIRGEFNNKVILFSSSPRYICFKSQQSLANKLSVLRKYNECSNTNIQKTLQLVLNTAIQNNLKQEDLPEALLIISDMEFDKATTMYSKDKSKLFETIEQNFKEVGYKMPKLIFWNVASRTNTIPVIENDLGVTLVSGYSPTIARMILTNKLDPFEALKEQLMVPRYDAVINAL